MKTILSLMVLFFLVLTISTSISTSFAIPELQLYIEGAAYDDSTETWVTTSNSFRLWVMGNVSGPGNHGSTLDVFLSAAYPTSESGIIWITPTTTAIVPDLSIPIAPSFVASGVGTQPTMGDDSLLPAHGIFGPGTSWTKY